MSADYPREWFRVNNWNDAPFARMFERETDAFLIRDDGRRDKKWTNYERWYPTREEAQAVIDERKANAAERVRMNLIREAAPELAAQLQEGVDLITGDLTGIEWKQATHAWLKSARAALAKALPVTSREMDRD